MKKNILKLARLLIPYLPRGRGKMIDLTLLLAGSKFNDFIESNGFKLFVNDITPMNKKMFFFNKYEAQETELIKKLLNKEDYFFDIGANVGWYSLLASRLVGNTGRVYAFELCKKLADEMSDN